MEWYTDNLRQDKGHCLFSCVHQKSIGSADITEKVQFRRIYHDTLIQRLVACVSRSSQCLKADKWSSINRQTQKSTGKSGKVQKALEKRQEGKQQQQTLKERRVYATMGW